jgi:3-methyladenine DNA glycosylase AlkC
MPDALKDVFFSTAFFNDLACAVQAVYPPFDKGGFLARIYDAQWDARALKDKMHHTTVTLHDFLPRDYRAALNVLLEVAPRLERHGFEKIFLSHFVALYGLDDWPVSVMALEAFTQAMSAEFAVRAFILKDQARMMAQMQTWARHNSPAVRRLASEGCRPRLPWAMALPALKRDPAPILPILELLKNDPSDDVRRSVANNLNDIAKDNPQTVIETLRRWQADSSSPQTQALIRHALRTLIKAGNPDALALLGYGDQPAVKVKNLCIEPDSVAIGESLTFSFVVESTSETAQELVIDYILHLAGANGKPRRKVFKLAKRSLQPGESVVIRKTHSFRPITTRKYYPGEHAVEIQINGAPMERIAFAVTAP